MDDFAKEFLKKEFNDIIKNLPASEQDVVNIYINSEKESTRVKVNYFHLISNGFMNYVLPTALIGLSVIMAAVILFSLDSCANIKYNNLMIEQKEQCEELNSKLRTEINSVTKENDILKSECISKIIKSNE